MSRIDVFYRRFIFSFLRNLHTVFHSGCTSLHFHKQCTEIPTFSPIFVICRHVLIAILTVVRWCLIFVLIYMSLIISDIEHLFMKAHRSWCESLFVSFPKLYILFLVKISKIGLKIAFVAKLLDSALVFDSSPFLVETGVLSSLIEPLDDICLHLLCPVGL